VPIIGFVSALVQLRNYTGVALSIHLVTQFLAAWLSRESYFAATRMEALSRPAAAAEFILAWLLTGAAEALCLAIAFCLAKSLRSSASPLLRIPGAGVLGLASISLVFLIAANLTSWFMQSRGLGFLSWGLLRSVLEHPLSTYDLAVDRDRILLLCAILSGGAASWAAYASAPKPALSEMARPLRWAAALLLLFGGGLLSLFNARDSVRLISYQLSPNSTLLWGRLVPTAEAASEDWDNRLASAERRQDLAAYRSQAETSGEVPQRPNILLIAVESLRAGEAETVAHGRPVMPTVAGLAPESLRFTQAYAQGNETAYSIPSIVTGLHALKSAGRDSFQWDFPYARIYDLLSPTYRCSYFSSADESWQGMSAITRSNFLTKYLDASHHIGSVLAPDAGDTAVWHSIERGRAINGGLDDSATTGEFLNWYASRPKDSAQPFFSFLNFQTSHYPYEMGVNVPKVFTPSELTAAERAASSFFDYPAVLAPVMRNRYRNSLAYIDTQIARVLGQLRQDGVLENTIVVIVGDHGQMFHENGAVTHGQRLFDKALHVHFQVWGARNWKPGDYSEPVGLIDLAPMLLAASGMPEYAGFQGQVPAQLEAGRSAAALPIPVFSSTRGFSSEDSVRAGRWKYVRHSGQSYEALHDLAADPDERKNRIADEPGTAACLSKALDAYTQTQIRYYRDQELREQRFPPRHGLPATPACQAAFLKPQQITRLSQPLKPSGR
jgi:arylsulfatase A-like enzyme